jgi:hypothetical protein
MAILEMVQDWPVIVQGALGSALFALVLFLGQSTTRFLTTRLRAEKETAEFFALVAWSNKRPYAERSTRGFFTCIYAALHFFLKAMIVLVLAWIVSPLNYVIAVVGYLISLYYLFRALSRVPHLSDLGNVDSRLDEQFSKINAATKGS